MKRSPEQNYQMLFAIWAILLFSQITLLFVLFIAKPDLFKFEFTQSILGPNPLIVGIFFMLVPVNFGISYLMKKRAFEEAILRQSFGVVLTGMLIACALCEAVSLLGVVLAFTTGYQYFFIFLALGFLGIIFHFPRRQDVYNVSFKK